MNRIELEVKSEFLFQVNKRDISNIQMSTNRSKCRKIGAVVRMSATTMTSAAECKRKYGFNFKFATVTGAVVDVIVTPKGTRKQTFVESRLDLWIGKEEKGSENL